jgi:hypothetical protein
MVSLAAESSYDTIMSCKDKHGKTALHHAAKNGNLVVLQSVASKLKTNQVGESPTLDILDAAKASPLWYALSNQHWKCAHCLLFMCFSKLFKCFIIRLVGQWIHKSRI